jgi:apolipoprotein N-acyltransferase
LEIYRPDILAAMIGIERRAWLLTILSAVLQVLIFPLANLYMLSWFAIAPLLVAVLQARAPETLQLRGEIKLLPAHPLQGFFLGYLCGILWYGGSCYWVYSTMKQYGGIGSFGAAGLLVLFCLYLALYHGAFGLIIGLLARKSLRTALVCSPFVWVGVELARTRISGFPWDLLGITQADNISLARIATFTGVYGLSLEIVIVNTAVAASFLIQRSRRRPLLSASLAAVCLLQAGRWLPAPALPTDRTAVLVQENIPVLDSADWTRQYFDDTFSDLSRISKGVPVPATSTGLPDSGTARPELVVWPESPAPFYSGDPLFRNGLSELARAANAWVVAGSIGIQNANLAPQHSTEIFNSAVLVSPTGEWDGRYDKVHLVPFGEYLPFKSWLGFAGGLTKEVGDFSAGSSRAPLEAGNEKLGIFICYESIFPDEVRRFAEDGAQVFVNISNDGWYGDSGAYAQHLKQARMRAIENARWLLRATNTGVTAAIDPYGRITQSVPRKTRTALPASYALVNRTTFYTRHGDWLAYGCAIISVGAVLFALTPGKGRRIA